MNTKSETSSTSEAAALPPGKRRELRALAHGLKPVAMIGQSGLTEAVLSELDRALEAHELVKIRVLGEERDHGARETLLAEACRALSAAPVQHIGRMLVIHRERSAESEPKSVERRGEVRRGSAPNARSPGPGERRSPGRAGSGSAAPSDARKRRSAEPGTADRRGGTASPAGKPHAGRTQPGARPAAGAKPAPRSAPTPRPVGRQAVAVGPRIARRPEEISTESAETGRRRRSVASAEVRGPATGESAPRPEPGPAPVTRRRRTVAPKNPTPRAPRSK